MMRFLISLLVVAIIFSTAHAHLYYVDEFGGPDRIMHHRGTWTLIVSPESIGYE